VDVPAVFKEAPVQSGIDGQAPQSAQLRSIDGRGRQVRRSRFVVKAHRRMLAVFVPGTCRSLTLRVRESFTGFHADEARSRYHRAMAGVFKALRAGLNGEPDVTEGDRFTAAGKVITCSHCAHDRFAEGHAQLNTAGMAE
jgi:hypothetical protein